LFDRVHNAAQGHELVACLVNMDPRYFASVLHFDWHLVESHSILWIGLVPASDSVRHTMALAR